MIPTLFIGVGGPERIAERLGVSHETARRYYYGRGNMPLPMQRLAHLVFAGDLSLLDPAWYGWRLHRGRLIDVTTATEFTAGDLRAYYLREQLRADYERQIRELTAALNKKRQARSLASWQRLVSQ